MIKTFLLLFIVLSSLFACKTEWKYGERSEACIIVNGEKIEFQYFMPNHAKGVHLPLLIVVSENYKNLEQLKSVSAFSDLSEKSASFIVIYPKLNINNNNEETRLISRLIEIVPRIDKSEIYLVSIDYDALLIQDLVCEIADQLKGMAVVNKNIYEEYPLECKSEKQFNTFYLSGSNESAYSKDTHQNKRSLAEKIIWNFRLIKVN